MTNAKLDAAQSAYDNRTPTSSAQEAYYNALIAEEEKIKDIIYELFSGENPDLIARTLHVSISLAASRRVRERNQH